MVTKLEKHTAETLSGEQILQAKAPTSLDQNMYTDPINENGPGPGYSKPD